MSNGCQLKGRQTIKPNYTCPCYISTSYLPLELVHLAKHNPTSIKNIHYLLLSFIFWFCLHFNSLFFLFLLYNNFLPISLLLWKAFCFFLAHSSLHFVKNKLSGGSIKFLHFFSDLKVMRKKNAKSEMGERVPHSRMPVHKLGTMSMSKQAWTHGHDRIFLIIFCPCW
jgi:hypothetical protein